MPCSDCIHALPLTRFYREHHQAVYQHCAKGPYADGTNVAAWMVKKDTERCRHGCYQRKAEA